MKKVQNQNAGLLQVQFHKRKMILDFDIFPSLTIAIGENMSKKDIALEDIQRVSIKDVKEAREIRRREKKERPRSSSSMKRMLTKVKDTFKSNEYDVYEYAFEIQMPERVYLFYTETEVESKRWVRVLSLLVSMNQAGLNLKRSGINPFDYEKYLV